MDTKLIAERLRRDIKASYVDSDGLITYQQHPGDSPNGSGNGLLLCSLYILTLRDIGELTDVDKVWFHNVVMDSSVERGLLNRGPHHHDQEAMDDYTAVTAASSLYGWRDICEGILSYGQMRTVRTPYGARLNYYYNNVKPGTFYHHDGRKNWSAWLGRMPQFVAHLHFAAWKDPGIFYRLAWRLAMWASKSADAKDTDAWLFSYLLCRAARAGSGRSEIHNAAEKWTVAFAAKHGNFKNLLVQLLGDDHPISAAYPAMLP